jgi:thiamine kinase-like enzyme
MLMDDGKLHSMWALQTDTGYDDVEKFLAEKNKTSLIPIYKALKSTTHRIMEVILKAGKEHATTTHTDPWSHNILVNSDPQKPIKLIDWQLLGYTDPAFDLVIFVLTTLPEESLNAAGIKRALRSYYDRVEELSKVKNIPLTRTFEDFERFFNTHALAFQLVWYVTGCPAIRSVPGADDKYLRILELFVELGNPQFILSVV